MPPMVLAGLLVLHATLTSGLTIAFVSSPIAGAGVAAVGCALGVGLVVAGRRGPGAAADAAGAGARATDLAAVDPLAQGNVPTPKVQVLVHGQGIHRRPPADTIEAAIGEQTEAKKFVSDHSAQAMPGLADIYADIQTGRIHGYLLVVAGPNRAKGVSIHSEPIAIGRAVDAQLQLSDGRVSNQQAIVRFRDGAAYVEDAGSRNGTFLNNKRVEGETRIENCDVIAFGGTKILVALRMDDSPGDDESAG